MILQRLRRLVGAAILVLAPSVGLAQSALQQPNLVASPGVTVDPLPSAITKLYQNDLFLQNLVAGRFNTLGAAAYLNVGTVAGTVADGGALSDEIARAQVAEQANAAAIQANTTAISTETSRAQAAEALKAPIASPTFTGVPRVPTAAIGTTGTQAASLDFVATAVAAGSSGGSPGVPSSRQVLGGGLATGGGDLTADRTVTVPKAAQSDVAAGTDDAKALTSYSVAAALGAKAPLASPAFVGTPTAPTAAAGTSTTQLATTAFAGTAASNAAAAVPAISYASPQSLTDPQIAQALGNVGLSTVTYCQCQLVYTSASQITLLPFGGNLTLINGAHRKIPATGVALSNSGLAASTDYWLYEYWTGSAIALEASTTGHVTDPTYGHEIKSGDPTRTLVGRFATDVTTPGNFVDTQNRRLVASWFNERPRSLMGATPSANTTASATPVEVGSSNRVEFVSFARSLDISLNAISSNNSAGNSTSTYIYVDGADTGVQGYYLSATANVQGNSSPTRATIDLAEGHHTVATYGKTGGSGTGSFTMRLVGMVRQ